MMRALLLAALVCSASVAHAQDLTYGAPYIIAPGVKAPSGIAIDEPRDRLLVLDTGGRRVLYTTVASLSTASPIWTSFGFVADINDANALLEPQGIAVDASGNVYVVNTFRNKVVLFRFDATAGTYTRDDTFASSNATDVDGVAIAYPRDIAVASDGKVYLLDSGNQRTLVADGPSDTSWAVADHDAALGYPYGIAIAGDGSRWLAAPVHHQVWHFAPPATVAKVGRFGEDVGGLRFPRDVAVMADGNLVIADSFNHRLRIVRPDGTAVRWLGSREELSNPVSVAVDSRGRIFVADMGYERVVAWLGGSAPKPYDLRMRDYVGDTGTEPSSNSMTLSSPDILVRHADANVANAAIDTLDTWTFEPLRYQWSNRIYVQVRNTGPLASAPGQVRFFWTDASSALRFPTDFSTDGFFESWTSDTNRVPGNALDIPELPSGGFVTLGPLIFRPPPDPDTIRDARIDLYARIVQLGDPTPDLDGVALVRGSNNVARRPLTITRGPFPEGRQDTLVIRARFPGTAPAVESTAVRDRVEGAGRWVAEVSHMGATITPRFLDGVVNLGHPPTYYRSSQFTPVIELATEVLNTLDPTVLDGDAADPADDIERLVIVVNDAAIGGHQATTGPWPYILGTRSRWMTVSIQGPDDDAHHYAHGLGHQLGLIDLLAHENVSFPRPFADGWDNMALPINGVHPLVWNKQHALWTSSAGGVVTFVPRPPPTSPISNRTFDLRPQTQFASGQTAAVVVGLTNGVTTLEEETRYLWIEARTNDGSTFDTPVPMDGVLAYQVTREIPQGQGPVVVVDHVTTPAGSLLDAAIPVAGVENVPGGVTLTVQSALSPGYRVRLDYAPPSNDYDGYLRTGDPPWMSPDIWVDNQELPSGFDSDHGRAPTPSEAPAIAGEDNHVYALVHNHGPAPIFNVEVAFFFSSPYQAIDGEGAFTYLASSFIAEIPQNEGTAATYVTWRPPAGTGDHHCVRVELRRMTDDHHPENDRAQRNLEVRQSRHGSPYDEIDVGFVLKNTDTFDELVYFRLDDVPKGWTWRFDQPKATIAPGATHTGHVFIKPSDDAQECRRSMMQLSSWRPRGDTLIRLGGGAVAIDTRSRTELTATANVRPCRDIPYDKERVSWANQRCEQIVTAGCTIPPHPNETILVRYQDPAGNPIYREVTTDAQGCFEDVFVSGEGGAWGVDVNYPGTDCAGSVKWHGDVALTIPSDGDHDNDGIIDIHECQGDPDNDGIPCVLDPDSNNDGIPDGHPGQGSQPPGKCKPFPALLVVLLMLAALALLFALLSLIRACRASREPPRWLWRFAAFAALVLALVAWWATRDEACPLPGYATWLWRIVLLLLLLLIALWLRCTRKRTYARG